MTKPNVVIIGAGFAGLWAARALAKKNVKVTLIDRCNYHSFLPLLYQVSAAEIEPEEISYPIRSILRGMRNVSFDMAEVLKIDHENKTVICEDHTVPFDYLIITTGTGTAFFHTEGAEENAFQLKTIDQAIVLRNHILSRFEHAVHEPDEATLNRRLTFVIVGGGPTGIEFTGAFSELIHGPLLKDFPEIDFKRVKIYMVEGKKCLLPSMPEKMQSYTLDKLKQKGVEVLLEAFASEVNSNGITLKNGERIESETVIWTAGVMGNITNEMFNVPLTRDRRIEVQCTLQVPGHPNIYVAGDLAAVRFRDGFVPMVAPVAMSQGETAARNILRQIKGEDQLAYEYVDKGSMVVIGRNGGVAQIGKICFRGFAAWLVWVVVHLMKLIGFRNRLLVLINWAWDYLFYERSVRLILPSCMQKRSGEKKNES